VSEEETMTTPVPPVVECEQEHAAVQVSDVAAAAEFYRTKLGFKVAFMFGDPPNIAGMNLGNVQMFLELGTPSPEGCSVYFVVGNADELYEFQRESGVEIVLPPEDRFYGLRDYRIRDLNGYELSFGHHLHNAGPAIEIERVDVSVRLEKRLAALLNDLAEHNHVSLTSLFEETFLHTLDGVGPHTKSTLRYIEKLKEKHGIDYDSHGSYRFVEK
jgi:uncharacterized glyoxalase superfamily protein PhnB